MARKNDLLSIYTKTVDEIKEAGLFKGEAPICSPQGAKVTLEDGKEYLNMCANNYLGLGNNQRLQSVHTMREGLVLDPFVLFAEHRISTNSLRKRSLIFLEQTIRFFILPALTQTVGFSRLS